MKLTEQKKIYTNADWIRMRGWNAEIRFALDLIKSKLNYMMKSNTIDLGYI